jgi:acetaldehyde dehydrogenase
VPTTADGVDGLIAMDGFDEIEIVFDATSAKAHVANAAQAAPYGKRLIDLTPAAIGPYVVPPVNLDEHLDAPNVNMVTCGGQATIPIVPRSPAVTPVPYAEIVASIASKSAGPGRGPTSTSSPRPPRTPSRRSAAPAAARRSSSSTRPSRR